MDDVIVLFLFVIKCQNCAKCWALSAAVKNIDKKEHTRQNTEGS
jgi:hypothetical protein